MQIQKVLCNSQHSTLTLLELDPNTCVTLNFLDHRSLPADYNSHCKPRDRDLEALVSDQLHHHLFGLLDGQGPKRVNETRANYSESC